MILLNTMIITIRKVLITTIKVMLKQIIISELLNVYAILIKTYFNNVIFLVCTNDPA